MSSELIWPTTPRNMIYTIDNLVYGNGVYVARQLSTSTILYSLDNITWQVALTYNIQINKIVYLNNLFIAVGQPIGYTTSMSSITPSNLIITSSDGINWTYRSSPAIFRLLASAYGNNTFVIVGTTDKGTNNPNYLLTSTDGFTWTLRYGPADNPWSGVAFGNGLFVAVTASGTWGVGEWMKTMVSTNGISWTLNGINFRTNQWHDIIYANNRFVAIGNQISSTSNGIMFSENGTTWVSSNNYFNWTQNHWRSLVYDGYYVYIIGLGQYIFRSRITNNTPDWTEITNYPKQSNSSASLIQHLNGQLFIMGPNNYLAVSLLTPVFSNFNSISKMLGDSSFTLSLLSNSSGSITYSSSNPAVATISGSTVTILGAGSVTITASQSATTNYADAFTTCSLTINKKVTTLSGFNNLIKTIGTASFALTPPISNSSGEFTYTSSNNNVATISGDIVTVVGPGSATITATQTETTDFEYSSASINCLITVTKVNPKLINMNITFIEGEYQIIFQSTSDGTYSYTFSDNTAVKINPNNTLTFLKKATVIVTIHQQETENYFKGTYSTIIDHNM